MNLLNLLSGGLNELNFGFVFKINYYRSIQDYYSKVIIDNYLVSFLSYLLYSLKRTPTNRFIKKNEPKQIKIIQKKVAQIYETSGEGPYL